MIVVTGATGNIGRKIAEILLKSGQRVRVVVRSADKAKDLKEKGAEVAVASLDDADALAAALKGADAAFLMIPPNYTAQDFRAYQNKISESLEKAVRQSGVKFVVNLSSVGAHRPEKGGPINGLYDHEQRLNKIPNVNVFHLRPCYFMENLLMNVSLIKNMGVAGSPLKPDVKLPMIATQDIAVEAVERLTQRDFVGKIVKELFGQRDLSMQEVTKVLGRAIGRPDLAYVQFPYADAEKAMTQMGLSSDVARLMIEMQRTVNDGQAGATQTRGNSSTTKTSIEEFAKTTFATVFKAG